MFVDLCGINNEFRRNQKGNLSLFCLSLRVRREGPVVFTTVCGKCNGFVENCLIFDSRFRRPSLGCVLTDAAVKSELAVAEWWDFLLTSSVGLVLLVLS